MKIAKRLDRVILIVLVILTILGAIAVALEYRPSGSTSSYRKGAAFDLPPIGGVDLIVLRPDQLRPEEIPHEFRDPRLLMKYKSEIAGKEPPVEAEVKKEVEEMPDVPEKEIEMKEEIVVEEKKIEAQTPAQIMVSKTHWIIMNDPFRRFNAHAAAFNLGFLIGYEKSVEMIKKK